MTTSPTKLQAQAEILYKAFAEEQTLLARWQTGRNCARSELKSLERTARSSKDKMIEAEKAI